ncbi:MAG: LacI family DNA-binding transcriptional regulator [Armatimonadetes bacterium]|nr:LacI family DNA-binding transcriptional regulator [Armatimonadota bacterium]
MTASLKDIAKAVGVSVSTVSYALNGGPKPVNSALRERILKVAADLDYRPNRIARAMVTGRSKTIGIIPGKIGPDMLGYPYIQAAMVGLGKTAVEVRHDMLLYAHSEHISDADLYRTLMDRRADGFVMIAPTGVRRHIEILASKGVPVVLVGGEPVPGVPVFACENQIGIGSALDYLIGLGHENIAFVNGQKGMFDADEREAGFRSRAAELKIALREDLCVRTIFSIEHGNAAATKLLSKSPRPTAIICGNDDLAYGVIEAARALGIDVPGELSITGFDNVPVSWLSHPPLTTVNQPVEEMASEAFRCLVQLIEGVKVPEIVRFPTELVIRETTAPPARKA